MHRAQVSSSHFRPYSLESTVDTVCLWGHASGWSVDGPRVPVLQEEIGVVPAWRGGASCIEVPIGPSGSQWVDQLPGERHVRNCAWEVNFDWISQKLPSRHRKDATEGFPISQGNVHGVFQGTQSHKALDMDWRHSYRTLWWGTWQREELWDSLRGSRCRRQRVRDCKASLLLLTSGIAARLASPRLGQGRWNDQDAEVEFLQDSVIHFEDGFLIAIFHATLRESLWNCGTLSVWQCLTATIWTFPGKLWQRHWCPPVPVECVCASSLFPSFGIFPAPKWGVATWLTFQRSHTYPPSGISDKSWDKYCIPADFVQEVL